MFGIDNMRNIIQGIVRAGNKGTKKLKGTHKIITKINKTK
jgi:hypothetical protein